MTGLKGEEWGDESERNELRLEQEWEATQRVWLFL